VEGRALRCDDSVMDGGGARGIGLGARCISPAEAALFLEVAAVVVVTLALLAHSQGYKGGS
jgi:hypothetical protein